MIRYITSRGSRGVAGIEVDFKHIGHVRRFDVGDWRGKLDSESDYATQRGLGTRTAAAEALVARATAVAS